MLADRTACQLCLLPEQEGTEQEGSCLHPAAAAEVDTRTAAAAAVAGVGTHHHRTPHPAAVEGEGMRTAAALAAEVDIRPVKAPAAESCQQNSRRQVPASSPCVELAAKR